MMRWIWLIILNIIVVNTLHAQSLKNEIHRTRFIADSRGMYAAILNPAGLAVDKDDDGVLVNYNVADNNQDDYEWNVALSMGNVGFSYQQDELKLNDKDYKLNLFQIALAVGNQHIAIGNVNKWIETDFDGKRRRSVDLSSGIMFRPGQNLSLAAMIHNPAEAEIIEGYQLEPYYSGGASLLLFEKRLLLNSEIQWTDDTKDIDDLTIRFGGSFYPIHNINVMVGMDRNHQDEDERWAGAYLILEGVSVGALVRSEGMDEIVRVSGEFRAALQSVKF